VIDANSVKDLNVVIEVAFKYLVNLANSVQNAGEFNDCVQIGENIIEKSKTLASNEESLPQMNVDVWNKIISSI
jgi:hypothetical protein